MQDAGCAIKRAYLFARLPFACWAACAIERLLQLRITCLQLRITCLQLHSVSYNVFPSSCGLDCALLARLAQYIKLMCTCIMLLQVREQDTVDTTRLAAIGYCFGGGGIVQLHHSWPNNTDGLLGQQSFSSQTNLHT